jgi:hypothetical protein
LGEANPPTCFVFIIINVVERVRGINKIVLEGLTERQEGWSW